ncbi:MAG: DEAD/DEAH box helicase family protein [Candidatus Gracilibacteria bacterium]|nr:DEAD/DEAH box helicase family protein [Candidatus Gracilibacteria bacterium]
MYAIISTFSKTFDEVGLVYFVPTFLEGDIKAGMIVEIPLKDQIEIGVVLKVGNKEELGLEIDESKIKALISIKNDFLFLKNYRLELLPFISSHYFTPIHNSACLFFPKNLREKIEKGKLKITSSQPSPLEEKELAQNPPSTLKEQGGLALAKREYSGVEEVRGGGPKPLSPSQQKAYDEIIKSDKNKILLHGITGSGKTEIYIHLIKDYLDKGKQTLLLIPEIILTNQLADRLKQVFGEDIIVLNSSVSEAKKTNYWLDIESGNAKLIIGTRSALFYPYNNLGLIIVDEEHDNSYISDSSPRYNGIEVAEKITELNGNKLLLGSGTPSVKSMYRALKGEYKLVNLFEKYT